MHSSIFIPRIDSQLRVDMTGFGEIVAPTAAISAILGTYPFSIGLLREILQNSDDAKARIQIFVLDHRTYPGSHLIDPRLVEAQGPSLLAYNNATFNEQDWIALQRINESSKREDTSKIGKYGVGFRSCYHITDSPQILSGSSLAILDPHHAYGPGGYKLTFTENPDAYADHLAAFCPSQFDPNWTPERPFEGTIIRLPLRQVASWSKISTKTLNTMEIKKLLLDFVKEEIDISLLFLSHISSTEIIEVDGHDRRVLGKVKIERAASPPASSSHVSAERLERCTVFVDDDSDGVLIRRSQDWCILHVTFPIEMCTEVLSPKLGPHTASRLQREKLKPILGLAVPLPLNHTRPGRLFTYLPLPLPTGFPLHVHALFALTQARQNLWSCSEKGMVRGTRDELLVEWNKVLFNTFIPKIWAHLLSRLLDDLKTPTDIFYAWPPESQRTPGGDPAYWQSLALRTLQSVVEENLSIWPLVHPHSAGSFGPMNSTFVATTSDIPFLSALSNAGIYATVPPAYIVEMLHTLDMKCQWLCPSEVQTALRNNLPSVANLRDEDKAMLLSYLTCDGSLQRVIGIPVIPLANGSYVALQNASHPSHVYLDDNEARLFADHDESAITLSRLPSSVQKLFQSSAANTVNITPLHASLVSQYLPKVFEVHGLLFSVSGATPTEMSIYLHEFWSWLSNWQDREALFPSIKHFAILPNSSGVHQVLDDIIFKQEDIDTSTQVLFLHLGIPFLAPNFPSSSIVFLERRGVVMSVYNLASLLDKLQTEQVGELDESGRRVLLSHFSNSLARHRGSPSQECEQRIKCLPIYPNFMYRDSATIVPTINYGPIPNESNLFINVPQVRMLGLDGSVLLPHIDGSKFVASQYGNMDYQSILSYLNIPRLSYLSESDLINRFIVHLHKQPKQVKRMFIQCLSRHQHDIAPSVVRSLRTTSFVPCGSGSTLIAPQDAIDPDSDIAMLFPQDDSRIPVVHDEEDAALVSSVRSLGLLCSSLSRDIVSERIRFISQLPSGQSKQLALRLLTILNESRFECTGIPELGLSWLPTVDGLSNATACRDINKYHHRALFDRVLRIVDSGTVQVTSRPLRKALGWDLDISLQIIKEQLSAELEAEHTAVSSKRLSTIIVELGRRVNEIRSDDGLLTQLREVTSQRPWIPVNSSTRAWTAQAVLKHDQFVPRGFYPIASTDDTIDFLRLMGCSDRPSNRAILNVLCGMDPDLGSTQSVDDVINLLRAIHVESLTEDDRRRVVAPDCHHYLRPLKELYMDDLGPQACQVELPTDMYKLHGEIQQRLATSLGVHTLTSLGLKQFEDLDDDDMQENLCTRISNVLRQYNIDQAFNEFLANAADAGATQYNLLLDERPGRSVDILAPTMSALQSSPSLIVHNDAVFKDEDFAGIRRVGLGGKQDRSDVIGKFGLGSLSMFHFTDMAMILSGGHVLFLDPSRRHLPANGNRLRSALKIPLSHLKRIHHDHLEVLDGLYGFVKNADYYNGTLFRLPLRATGHSDISSIRQFPQGISVLLNEYEERAAQSVFFIAVNTITASRRDALGRLSQMWSINTTRQSSSSNLIGTPIRNAVTISRGPVHKSHGNDEKWHIVTEDLSLDNLPLEYHPLIEKQRLRSVSLAIATLVTPRDREKGRKHRLYSKLPLPTLTSLPVHIDASFILADDRRSIRFEEGGQVNLESRYNSWLLTSRVPTLYYFLLESWPQAKGNTVSWPGNSSSSEDPISRLLVHSFYDQISSSSYRFCESLKGERLLPSRAVFEDGETQGVKHILDLMKPAEVVELPSRIRSRLPAKGIRHLDVDFFHELIATQSLVFQSLYQSKRITVQQIRELVEYMGTGRPDSLVDLKVLPLVDDSLGVIKKSGNPPFFFAAWSKSWHPWHLFTTRTSRFIHPDFGSPTWPLRECNIERYSTSSFISLLREILTETNSLVPTPEKKEFINRFWHDFIWLSVTINQVSNFPLIPTQSGTYISFSHSHDPSTIVYDTDTRRPWLGEVLESLGADVVIRDACPRILRNELRDSEFSFDVIMKFLETLGVSNIPRIFRERLDIDAQNRFAVYARKEISSLRSGQMTGPRRRRRIVYSVIHQATARQLPIWESSIGDCVTLVPASDPLLKMVPYGLDQANIEPFVDATNAQFVKYNTNLQDVLDVQPLDITDVFRYLQFPGVLPQEQLPLFNQLLKKLLDHAAQKLTQISLKVPNYNCLMVNVSTLYAYSRPIFRSTFGRNLRYFLHPTMRNLESKLANVGLKYQVDVASFKSCARFIDAEVKETNSSEGAPAVFDWYNRSMWSFVGNNQPSWQEVKDLAFIPRSDIRRHYTDSSFTAEDYSTTLPMVVPPSRILRSEYEAVAWTQRALFDVTPSEQLLLANPTLGIPDGMDVVEHLRLLVVIAAEHPFNNNLASDLTETYRWLADHIPDCEAYLRQQQNEKLFLNVDSLTLTIKWEFCSAPQLVFNAPDEGTRMQVRRYLHPFKKLLLAVGAKEVVKPVQPALKLSPAEEVLVKLRTSLNDQRKKEMLTDTVLESNDGQKFPAHKTLLAASTQYFEALFCGGYLETSQTKPVDVDVSGDVLAHVLEYIYLGKIQDIDDQDDLLEMLEVSDLWALPDLFLRVENQLILTITIGTYQELMEKADLYGAKELLAACKKFVDDNAHIF
ncbi:hypothetical protein C8Q75DRAFT_894291 [Abortiporus biennis]|nr:hypothetical protein C8Q75DRAFT_894291 [Abortiporus biennis]